MGKYGVPYVLPDGSLNPVWAHAFYLAHKETIKKRNTEYALAHRGRMNTLRNAWNQTHREWNLEIQRRRTLKFKKLAILKTNGTAQCAIEGCGCDDLSLLQANYKEGGHARLVAKGLIASGGLNLYRGIARGKVDPKSFNFLCPPHNSIDHLRDVRGRFTIRWNS
jgi:hypothetical protein